MKIESGNVLVLNISDKARRLRVSKVDGNLVKLIDEAGVYSQMPIKNIENMLENGFARIEKIN